MRHKKKTQIVCALDCLCDRARALMATFLRRNRYNSRRQEIHGRVFVCWLPLHRHLLLLIPSNSYYALLIKVSVCVCVCVCVCVFVCVFVYVCCGNHSNCQGAQPSRMLAVA
jgi:hypothetical protein